MNLKIVFLILFLPACALAQSKEARLFVLGHTEVVNSTILAEDRTLNIYLPAGYDTIHSCQVVYLLDGSTDEDFIHIAGLVQYFSFPWVANMPPTILVGIANTQRRKDFTFPTRTESDRKLIPVNGGSGKFMDFIGKELMPFIKANYRINDTAVLIGQSLGGLLATEILFERPQLFDKYIIVSPSLWWDDGSLLKREAKILRGDYQYPTEVYIGVGKEGSIDGTDKHVMEEDAKLLADMLKANQSGKVKVHFDYMPGEDHATAGHPAVFNAFRLLYGAR